MAEMVQAAWAWATARGESPLFMQKTNDVHDKLHTWDHKVLKGSANRIKQLEKELERVRRGPLTDVNIATQKELLVWLELFMEQEELAWIQRAHANWLRHGDRNTSFFQHYASSRKKKIQLRLWLMTMGHNMKIAISCGLWCTTVFPSYYNLRTMKLMRWCKMQSS